MADNIQENTVVSMDYTLTLDDGQVIDSSEGREPLQFIQGQGQIIPGLEKELYGMKVGDEKRVTVSPDEGYGEWSEDEVQSVPRTAFPPDADFEEGMVVQLQDSQTERVFQALIKEIQADSVVLDFNHPLAGETLNFEVRIADLRQADSDELAHGHVHGVDGHGPDAG